MKFKVVCGDKCRYKGQSNRCYVKDIKGLTSRYSWKQELVLRQKQCPYAGGKA